MSNIVQFPLVPPATTRATPHVAARLLDQPPPSTHAVQFYDDDTFLVDTVAQFLEPGLIAGDCAIVVATGAHTARILHRLEPGTREAALRSGQLVLVDAEAMLSQFMVGEIPDEALFMEAIRRLVSGLPSTTPGGAAGGALSSGLAGTGPGSRNGPHRGVRAFGEMVDLLWRDGKSSAALRLEELWNRAAAQHSIALLCAYAMGNFYKQDDIVQFDDLCRLHTHVMPTEHFTRELGDYEQLRRISLLEQRSRLLDKEVQYRREVEGALREALEARARAEQELHASIARERHSQLEARASSTFRELFVRLLDPLQSVLQSARQLAAAPKHPTENDRMHQLAAGCARVQRLIEQVLVAAREQLEEGIAVELGQPENVVPLVAGVVDRIRAANPGTLLELDAESAQHACFDARRLQQVIAQLVQSMLAHGDPARPVTVSVATREALVGIRVHNPGEPIDSRILAGLFEPGARDAGALTADDARAPESRLCIAQRIVAGHGGSIDIQSSAEVGTSFEVRLPLQAPGDEAPASAPARIER